MDKIFKFLKNLFKGPEFTIEYYPETDRYYPKYGHRYIQRDWQTGIYKFEDPAFFMFADFGKTEKEARRIIELVKEQQMKENVKVIDV